MCMVIETLETEDKFVKIKDIICIYDEDNYIYCKTEFKYYKLYKSKNIDYDMKQKLMRIIYARNLNRDTYTQEMLIKDMKK